MDSNAVLLGVILSRTFSRTLEATATYISATEDFDSPSVTTDIHIKDDQNAEELQGHLINISVNDVIAMQVNWTTAAGIIKYDQHEDARFGQLLAAFVQARENVR